MAAWGGGGGDGGDGGGDFDAGPVFHGQVEDAQPTVPVGGWGRVGIRGVHFHPATGHRRIDPADRKAARVRAFKPASETEHDQHVLAEKVSIAPKIIAGL